ncbi:acetate---CoA ligase [Synchytrium microbalum]|uniref:Acetate---CoA ligase n=1 Tax=Synchytrium microbalum TaxID=1806994 RepID=A0A507BXI9_9FUNG|nr:acetate---CoA ligase [Synchytrium microbalum]TPX31811.1 acetate---CoA ligase [Synchytrium microbalum]
MASVSAVSSSNINKTQSMTTASALAQSGTYQAELVAQSLSQPENFWRKAAECVSWVTKPNQILEINEKTIPAPHYRWFPDAELNVCYNCVDRHVTNGNGSRTAIIYDSPVTATKEKYTYAQTLSEVETLAGVLRKYGVAKGDTVLIYMPMVPQAMFGMLACARLGAVHSVVFGGFAPKELCKRIDDCKPKVILAASCGVEGTKVIPYMPLLNDAISMSAYKPPIKIVCSRPQVVVKVNSASGERDWAQEMQEAKRSGLKAAPVTVKSTDPLYLLYTSGSTGTPKGVVRDSGGYLVALGWAMPNFLGMTPEDTIFCASDVGWVVGHSYIVYGPLLNGSTTILYEGKPVGTPDASAFWRLVQEYKVKVISTAPTAIRAIKRDDPEGEFLAKYDISTLESVYLAGERSDPDTVKHFQNLLKVPIRDNYWQTESGWQITATCQFDGSSLSTPVKIGSAGQPMPGYDMKVLVAPPHVDEDDYREQGKAIPWVTGAPNVLGNLVIKLPLPPGCFPTLWNNHSGYMKSYMTKFPGYYDTTDAAMIDQDGYVSIMARTDDIINVAGHRLSTGGMEEICSGHQSVAECAVLGVADQLKGEVPVGFVVLKNKTTLSHAQISQDLVQAVRNQIGAIACFQKVYIVSKLPKTRSGKILRRTIRAIANGVKYEAPATIEDDSVLAELHVVLSKPKL